MKRIWVLLVVFFLLCLSTFLFERQIRLLMPYSDGMYSGDGTITDFGFWSYPRYRISFPEVALTQRGDYVYSAKGLPPKLTFSLRVFMPSDQAGQADVERELRALTSLVTVRITDGTGNIVCDHSSSLADWVLSTAVKEAEFWHPDCRDLKFNCTDEYKLHIQVETFDHQLRQVLVQPLLSGGGNELP